MNIKSCGEKQRGGKLARCVLLTSIAQRENLLPE